MTRSLGRTVLLLSVAPHALGFSQQAVANQQRQHLTKLAYGRLSSDAKRPLLNRNVIGTSTFADDEDPETAAKQAYDTNLFIVAGIPPIIAFLAYTDIARAIASMINMLGFNGSNVDGNAFSTNLLRPTLNGVVVPATGIGLGTLFATTVNVLWNRQLMLRSTINKEVCELRLLRRAIFGSFGTAQHSKRRATALSLLLSYTRTLISETQTECIARLENIQKEGGISMNELDELAEVFHGVDGAAASRQSSVAIAGDLLISLNNHRSERVATTLSGFPRIHWFLLDVLYLCIVLSFLVDSNQEVNQYLNSIQLQVLFAILASVGSGASMLLKDLEDPFQGTFCINLAAKQLSNFEELLATDIAEAEQEQQQVGAPALISFDRARQRPNYNAANTVYFHLLTGPLGANVRFFGDIFAWTFRRITKSVSAVKNWALRRPKRPQDGHVSS